MTKKEQAAAYFCTIVKATTPGIGLEFTVNWRNHPIWGRCPSIRWCGDLIASAQGCGYDKLSAMVEHDIKNPYFLSKGSSSAHVLTLNQLGNLESMEINPNLLSDKPWGSPEEIQKLNKEWNK